MPPAATCAYVLDPDSPETWGGGSDADCHVDNQVLNEDGVWNCPHPAEDGEYCLFHTPVAEKDDAAVTDAFLDAIEDDTRTAEFLGAAFGSLSLHVSGSEIAVEGRETHMTGERCELATEERAIDISYATIEAFVGTGARFEADVVYRGVEFAGEADFQLVEFDGDADFRGATFRDEATFWTAAFAGDAYFRGAQFETTPTFSAVTFHGDAYFQSAAFEKGGEFGEATFGGKADFGAGEFWGFSEFGAAEFDEEVDFSDAVFEGDADFFGIEFGAEADFGRAAFEQAANFREADLTGCVFRGADLTDATFVDARLCSADMEAALLSRATLFGTDFRQARIAGAVLGDVRIDEETRFLGRPEAADSSPHTLNAIRSRPRCVYDPSYGGCNEQTDVGKAKSVYRALEELAGKAARPRLQSRCFVRRQDLQTEEYRRAAATADDPETTLVAGARWGRAKVARATLLYGESPWRIVAASLGVIVLFSLLYPVWGLRPSTGPAITYPRIVADTGLLLDSLYYSTLTFTTGPANYQPLGAGRVLTVVNTAVGPVLIALLVFVFGRRAAR